MPLNLLSVTVPVPIFQVMQIKLFADNSTQDGRRKAGMGTEKLKVPLPEIRFLPVIQTEIFYHGKKGITKSHILHFFIVQKRLDKKRSEKYPAQHL
jgi:hypothetical protein